MANIYDVASAIQQPNIPAAFQQGVQTARANTMGNIAVQQAQQQQSDAQTLRQIAPQVIAGDPSAYAQAAALNPDQANSLQGAGDAQLAKIRGAINYLDQQTTPEAKQAAYQNAVKPFLAPLAAANGHQIPDDYQSATPGIDAMRAKIASLPANATTLTPGSVLADKNTGAVLYNNQTGDKFINAPVGPNGEKGLIAVNPHGGGQGQIVTLGGGTGAPSGMASPDFYNAVNGLAGKYGATITSGVRDAQHNADVGGVPNSQHLTGTAADVVIPPDQKAQFIQDAKAQGLQPIDEGDHVHLQNPNGGAGVSGVRLAVGTPVQKPSSLTQRIDVARSLGATDDDIKALALGHGNAAPADSGLSADAINNLSWQYALNGQLPPVGRGGAGQAQRTAVINATADLAKQYGVSPQELATTSGRNKAFQASLSNTQKQTDTIDRSSETFHQNADLMQRLADQVGAEGPQAWNQFVIGVKNKVTTDPTVAAYLAAQQTASQEYAKVASGATGAAGSTDSAREHANAVINAFQTPDQLRAVLGTLRQDTENQRNVAHTKLNEIRTNMQQFGTSGTNSQTTNQSASPASNPSSNQAQPSGQPQYRAVNQKTGHSVVWNGSAWVDG